MSANFKSILSGVGHFAAAVLKWFGSPTGQLLTTATEAAVETWVPASAGAINLFNKFATEAIKVETLGVAAGVQAGQGSEQKAAAVISAVGSEAVNFAEKNGLETPTGDKLKRMNDLAVEWLNLFVPKNTLTAPTPVQVDVMKVPTS